MKLQLTVFLFACVAYINASSDAEQVDSEEPKAIAKRGIFGFGTSETPTAGYGLVSKGGYGNAYGYNTPVGYSSYSSPQVSKYSYQIPHYGGYNGGLGGLGGYGAGYGGGYGGYGGGLGGYNGGFGGYNGGYNGGFGGLDGYGGIRQYPYPANAPLGNGYVKHGYSYSQGVPYYTQGLGGYNGGFNGGYNGGHNGGYNGNYGYSGW